MSHQMPDRDTAAQAARGLTAALEGMRDELGAVNARQDKADRFGARSRFLIRLTICSICLDLILTFALVFVYGAARNSAVEAQNARVIAATQHTNLVAACRLTNQSRAASIMLWTHLGAISKPAPGTSKTQAAKQRRQVDAFLGYVRRVYAPRNCVRLYRVP